MLLYKNINIIEKQLTEVQAQLILERHKNADLNIKYNELQAKFIQVSTDKDIAQNHVTDLVQKVIFCNLISLQNKY